MVRRYALGLAAVFGLAIVEADAGQAPPRSGVSIEYRLEHPAHASSVLARSTKDQRSILEKLNRADASHLPALEQLVVPTLWLDELEYSPFPQRYAPTADLPKLLIVDLSAQAFAGYENGVLVRWGPVSSGRRTAATPDGLFHLTWRSRGRHSSVNPEWFMEWYFNFDNVQGLSLHSYRLPGRPASHGCIRLLERDARWIYDWGDGWTLDHNGKVARPGTPVLILGRYGFDSPPPWRDLVSVTRGIRLPDQ